MSSSMARFLGVSILFHRIARFLFPSNRFILSRLADKLFTRYVVSGKAEDLQESITLNRDIINLGFPNQRRHLVLAIGLSLCYQLLGKTDDLEESISAIRGAVGLCPPGHPDLSSSLNFLANGLSTRYDLLRKMEDLEEIISLHNEILSLRPVGHPDRVSSLNNVANCLSARYDVSGKIEDLEEAISLHQEVLSLRPLGHPDHASSLNNFALSLSTRYDVFGKSEDLEESISLHRKALSLRPLGHPDHSTSLTNLANSLSIRYGMSGTTEDLEEAISFYREALTLPADGHPDQAMSLSNLANSLLTRYDVLGKIKNLEESILLLRQALSLRPLGHPYRSIPLNNLAKGLSSRYGTSGKLEDLEEAISLYREALSLHGAGHPDQAMSLSNLANSLLTRYENLGKIEDLEESIPFLRQALGLRPLGHPYRSIPLNNLAKAMSSRYGTLGRMDDLEDCILLYREALRLHCPGHPDHGTSLSNLADSLSTRYDVLGKIEDLEEAIPLLREALSLRPIGHPYRSIPLNNLAKALSTRYDTLGRVEDLEDCIVLYCEALSLHRPGHPDHGTSLSNLANSLSNRYDLLSKTKDLEESIALLRNALSVRPLGHPNRAMPLNNLAKCLSTRYSFSHKMEDLEDCILLYREALTLHPPGHPNRATSLNNLASSLFTRDGYGALDNIEDLKESFSLHRDALTLRPPGHPDHCRSLSSLATLHLKYYTKLRQGEHLQKAFLLYEQAACDGTSFLQSRLRAALQWANAERSCPHDSILSAYRIALQLLNRCLTSHSSVESQQRFLATAHIPRTLASDAASAAIDMGNIELAAEFLEQGRAMLWSRVDGFKYPFQQLREVEGGKELADRLEVIGPQLERIALSSQIESTSDKDASTRCESGDAQIKQHRLLSEEWENLMKRIRDIEGFDNFLQTPPFEFLQSAAAEGPVILVNISSYRSDAIILLKDRPPVLVPFPEMEVDELKAQKLGTEWEIKRTLRYLWFNIVSPVVKHLSKLGIPKKSRIWWCPTGVLSRLPLHAACHGKKSLQDLYVSSYTSTLSSLVKARTYAAQSSAMPKLLIVGEPSKTVELERVKDEVNAITALSLEKGSVNVLFGPDAHSEAVINHLKYHPWAHLACHGHLGDDNKPFQASFELHDRRLPLLDLIRARLPNAELAFLSACHSAEGDSITPDESIHLSAALQFCGFRSVIGTLWEMDDEDGPVISKLFYEYMFRHPERIDFHDSAHALNFALKQMKEDGVPIDRLALFVHIGA